MGYKARLKVVPNDEPNADGDWIEVACDDALVEKIKVARSLMRLLVCSNTISQKTTTSYRWT